MCALLLGPALRARLAAFLSLEFALALPGLPLASGDRNLSESAGRRIINTGWFVSRTLTIEVVEKRGSPLLGWRCLRCLLLQLLLLLPIARRCSWWSIEAKLSAAFLAFR